MTPPAEARHALEQERIFRSCWLFAGFGRLLARPNAFVTRVLGGIPIVIQNFDGELRAFENRCAHRGLPLQWEFAGVRPLACRYHGWSYVASGAAMIPQEAAHYRFSEAERARACLRSFALRQVGDFVFVNLAQVPGPLEEQFDPGFLAGLAEVSRHFDGALVHASVRARFDWQLAFENVLDPNHVHHLHARSFGPSIPRHAAPAPLSAPASVRELSVHEVAPFAALKHADWHARVDPYGAERQYHNWFIHPNVNFVSIAGYSFSLQQFVPVAPGETEILVLLFLSRRREGFDFWPAVLWHNLQAEKRVLDEDVAALERLAAARHDGARPDLLGASDGRVARFRRWHAAATA